MPAVHVEPCFVTNPREEAQLRTAPFRGQVATAIVTALERFFDGDVSRSLSGPAEDPEHQPETQAQGDRPGRPR